MLYHFEYTDQLELLKFIAYNFLVFPFLVGFLYLLNNVIGILIMLIFYVAYFNILLSKIKLNSVGSAVITNSFVEFNLKKKIIVNFTEIEYYKIDFLGNTTIKI